MAQRGVATMTEWLSTLSLDDVTAYGVLVLVLFLLVTGVLITRRTADREVRSLVNGYKVKDEAHAEVLAAKDRRIYDLEAEREAQARLIERREDQLGAALDEMGPTLIALSDAVQTVVLESDVTREVSDSVEAEGGPAGGHVSR